jgi:hypothetical protein
MELLGAAQGTVDHGEFVFASSLEANAKIARCNVFVRFYLSRTVLLAVASVILMPPSFGQAQNQASSLKKSLDTFLQNYLGPVASGESNSKRYFSVFADLQDDGTHEAIVYLMGRDWCGSGGCTVLILAPQGSSFGIVTKITLVQLPIRVLATKSNGWHDLGVWVGGGGIQPGHEAKLSFNGKTYPKNPTVGTAQRLTQKVAGEVVVPTTIREKPTT